MNVRATAHLLDFLRECDHAALLHLSTCYAVGRRDGRILEEFPKNYTPVGVGDFDAEKEWHSLEALIRETEARAESPEVTEELRRQALKKEHAAKEPARRRAGKSDSQKSRPLAAPGPDGSGHETRQRARLAQHLYVYKEPLRIADPELSGRARRSAAIAVVRPSIVESSVEKPFLGWNEGMNTSASLSYLLGTFFRQLPTNESKCLDLIPVDLVCRGMTLISAALVARRHERVYQLATSVANPCDMRRSIELTGLGHRKYYRSQNGFQHRLRLKFDAIPVSKARYEKLSAPAQKMIVQAINRSVEPMPFVRRRWRGRSANWKK